MGRREHSFIRRLAGLLKNTGDIRWLGVAVYTFLIVSILDTIYFRTTYNSWLLLVATALALGLCIGLWRRKGYYYSISSVGWALFIYCFCIRALAPFVHFLGTAVTHFVSNVLTLFGLTLEHNGEYLDILTGTGWLRTSISAELIGLWPAIAASVVVLVVANINNRTGVLARILIGLTIVMPIVSIVTLLIVSDIGLVKELVDPFVQYMKIMILVIFLTFGNKFDAESSFHYDPSHLRVGAGMLCIMVAVSIVPLGMPRQINILIDNTHGEWEPTDRPMLTEEYGKKYTYTYSELTRLLRMYGTVEEVSQGPLTTELLKNYNVVLLKTPSIPFSETEICDLESFVSGGGGVIALGDHTNLMGMSTILNQVLAPYGIRFMYDDTFDPRTGGFVDWKPAVVDLTPLYGSIKDTFRFETGCSVRNSSARRCDLLTVRESASEPLRWENPGFFGNIALDPWEHYGNFCMCTLSCHGSGKVVAFTDSTLLSNFSLFFPGRRELLLSWINILTRQSSGLYVQVGLAILGMYLLISSPKHRLSLLSVGLILALCTSLSIAGTNLYYELALPALAPKTTVPNLAFVGNFELEGTWHTALSDYQPDFPTDYSTFFVASQRLGFTPVWYDNAKFDSTALGAVFVNTSLLSRKEYLDAARSYVASGRTILLLRSAQETDDSSTLAAAILGHDALANDGPVESSTTWIGSAGGRVIVFEDREMLARSALGKVTDIPTEDVLVRYQVAYALFRNILEGN